MHIGKPAREDSAFSKLTWQSVAKTEPRQIEQLSASQRISVVRRLKLGICRRSMSHFQGWHHLTSYHIILSYYIVFLYSIEWLGHSSCTHKLQLTAGDASGHCQPLGLELVIRPLNRNTKAASESDQWSHSYFQDSSRCNKVPKATDVSILTAGNVTVCQHVSAPSLANHQLFHVQPPVLGPNQFQIRLQSGFGMAKWALHDLILKSPELRPFSSSRGY